MEMKHELVGCKTVGSPQLSASLKSAAFAPLMVMEFTLSAWLPVLDSVTICAKSGVPTAVLAKVSPVGVSVATGPTSG